MAVFDDETLCALCRQPIASTQRDSWFSTSFYGINHPVFSVLDDATAHGACVANWEHRDAFVEYYNTHCANELRIDRKGNIRYRRSWLDLTTNTALLYLVMPIFLPLLGWSRVPDRSCASLSAGALIPVFTTAAVGFLAAFHFGAVSGWASVIVSWSAFVFSGDVLLRSDRK